MKLLFWSFAIFTAGILATPVKAAPEAVKQLLDTNECPNCDLSEADLTGRDLSYANLQGANLSNTNLSGANLSNADLSQANLSGANLSQANLIAVDFRNANLTRVAGLDALSRTNTPQVGVQVSQLGQVRAELYYQQEQPSAFAYTDLRLRLFRNGQLLLEHRPLLDGKDIVAAPTQLKIQDLEGDREPEVILDSFSGGAHCCSSSSIYHYVPESGQYYFFQHPWQHTGYQLKDLDQDGLPEFASYDNSFAYAFASFAGSGFPVQIWQYRHGKMLVVTRRYPQQIYASAFDHWTWYQAAKQKDYEVKGLLAAYLANKYLLNQGQDGWRRLRQVYQESDRSQYFADLRQFLQAAGYLSQD